MSDNTITVSPVEWPPAQLDTFMRDYFERRRDCLIAELRALDRLLGRPQTIPPRHK